MKKLIENKSGFRVVPDTNVIISSRLTKSETSPTKEFNDRWLDEEFVVLYSRDTQLEYIKKLQEKQIPKEKIRKFLSDLSNLGETVVILHFLLPYYPADKEDYRFVLCAENGDATHIVSYDRHLLDLQGKFKFKIVKTVPFLKELRAKLKEK